MSSSRETAAVIVLLRLDRQAPLELADAIQAAGSALAVLEHELAQQSSGQPRLFPAAGPEPERDPEQLLGQALTDITTWRQRDITVLTVLDSAFPINLHTVHDRPPLIFIQGTLIRADERSVAIIGSRRASQPGLDRARATAASLAGRGYTIVSGLAAGIDTAAHTAALNAGHRTVAVIGTGLDHAYPPANQALQQTIVDRGAVISQFWPDTPPSRTTFPQRNALMSGLSRATVIIEAGERSGARVQARRAVAHGRPVLIARDMLDQEWARILAARPGVSTFATPAEIDAQLERLHDAGVLSA